MSKKCQVLVFPHVTIESVFVYTVYDMVYSVYDYSKNSYSVYDLWFSSILRLRFDFSRVSENKKSALKRALILLGK